MTLPSTVESAYGRGPWLQSLTGKRVHVLDPRPEEISLRDIAGHLAKVNRFGGATCWPYSVAQHCVEVAKIVAEPYRIYALLHDAHEAYLGDRLTPIKWAMRDLAPRGVDPFVVLADQFDAAIHARFGLAWPLSSDAAEAVKAADLTLLATERRDLLAHDVDWGMDLPAPLIGVMGCVEWHEAEAMFLQMATQLGLQDVEGA